MIIIYTFYIIFFQKMRMSNKDKNIGWRNVREKIWEKKTKKKRKFFTLADLLKKRIRKSIKYPKKYMGIMRHNYPTKTEDEIIEGLKKQKNYPIRFFHLHEWISWELIKKYLLLDELDSSDVVKVTLDTDEVHDCNLLKLTPELKEKAYWGYRWDRKVVSHLIDNEDCPGENKTSKLTVVWKRDIDTFDDEPYFFVITAFWGDWNSGREPRDNEYILKDMNYRMNYALIPEEGEEIEKTSKPMWANIYDYLTNSIWYCDDIEYMCERWDARYLKIEKEWKYWILVIHWDEIRWLDTEQNLVYDKIVYTKKKYWDLYIIVEENWNYEMCRISSGWEKMSNNINGKPLYISSHGYVIFEAWWQIFIKKFSWEAELLPWELYSDCRRRLFSKNWWWKKVYMEEFLRMGDTLDWEKVS